MSGKEKLKFDEMAKADKVRYDREMKDYGPAKGGKKKKDPNAPKRPPSGFFLFCSESLPKSKSTNPGISIGDVAKKLGRCGNNLSDSEKQPYNKAAKLKEKYEKDVADYKSKGKFDGAKGPTKVARKKVEEDEEDKEEEEEEEEGGGGGRIKKTDKVQPLCQTRIRPHLTWPGLQVVPCFPSSLHYQTHSGLPALNIPGASICTICSKAM
ncbi:high mobility group protein B3-like [Lycaon pictus]